MANAAMAGTQQREHDRKKICHVPGAVDPRGLDELAGSSVMKLCSRKIASGSAEDRVGDPDRPEGARPARGSTKQLCSSGISVTWSGTICSAKIAMKKKSRPLNSIQAKA